MNHGRNLNQKVEDFGRRAANLEESWVALKVALAESVGEATADELEATIKATIALTAEAAILDLITQIKGDLVPEAVEYQ